MHEKRFNASHAHRLDDPARLLSLPPAEVLAALDVQPGMKVADIGAGTGYFSLPLAHAVGAQGNIWSVDSQREMISRLRQKLDADESLANIQPVLAEADNTTLPDTACNLVLLANVWHEFEDRTAVLRETMRILAPGGRVAILDWRNDVEPVAGPPLAHRIASSVALAETQLAGFEQVSSAAVGVYHWLVQGKKPR